MRLVIFPFRQTRWRHFVQCNNDSPSKHHGERGVVGRERGEERGGGGGGTHHGRAVSVTPSPMTVEESSRLVAPVVDW